MAKKTHKKAHKTTKHEHKEHHKQHKEQAEPLQPSKTNWPAIILGVVVIVLVIILLRNQSTTGNVDNDMTGADNGQNTTAQGTVIIEEFSDFECPYCARAQPTLDALKQKYGDQIEIVYKHLPLSFHPNAQKAAEASECARDQGQFWPYHDILFANQDALTLSDLKQYAADLSLDTEQFNTCLDTGEKASVIQADLQEAQERGASGTPTFFIAGEKLVGAQPQSAFEPVIQKALTGQVTPPQEDPEVELTIITDETCSVCDPTQIANVLTTDFFPTAQVTTIDLKDAASLVDELGITAVPAFIFSENVDQTNKYADVADAFNKRGGKYIITPAAVGTVKLLNPPTIGDGYVKGDDDAPITMIEYSDFECPFCGKFYSETLQQIETNYIDTGKVKFVYKHFPLSFHQQARPAALAAECAGAQGQFWQMHDLMYENQDKLSESQYKQWATDLGLDVVAFEQCYDSGQFDQKITAQFAQGQANGISGTPGFIIDGIVLSGALPYEAFAEILDEQS